MIGRSLEYVFERRGRGIPAICKHENVRAAGVRLAVPV